MKDSISRVFRLLLILTFVVLMPLSAHALKQVFVEVDPNIPVEDGYEVRITYDGGDGVLCDIVDGVATRQGNPLIEWHVELDSELTPTNPDTWYQNNIPAATLNVHWYVEE